MSTEANRLEFVLIEAAFAGDTAAAHALLDHLREQDEDGLADELAPLLATVDGPRVVAMRLALTRINALLATVASPIGHVLTMFQKAMGPGVARLARIDWRTLVAAAEPTEAPPTAGPSEEAEDAETEAEGGGMMAKARSV
jgi:hypothetical protein